MLKTIKSRIDYLNKARNAYYNESNPIMSDREYDSLFDELKKWEDESGIYLSNSPTQSVGFEVQSKLKKVTHKYPLLSLDKTKSVADLNEFKRKAQCLLMYKLDGLTVMLTYDEEGNLELAETRGNGTIGEDITSNAKHFANIPLKIKYHPKHQGKFIIVGEAVIDYPTFESINQRMAQQGEEEYKNPRNLVSGTVRQLDSKVCADRSVKFYAFDVKEGVCSSSRHNNLKQAKEYGFDDCKYYCISTHDTNVAEIVESVKENNKDIPIDGLVMIYDDINYSESLGTTSHHPRFALAFKYEDESVTTTLLDILVDVGKSGQVSYTALFEPVEIDGTTVEKASVHNYEYIQALELGIGDTISVVKCNMIIPQIIDNETRSGTFEKVLNCPFCGSTLVHQGVHQFCTNYQCEKQVLGRLIHFCSRNAMDIQGFSEESIKKIMEIRLPKGESVLTSVADIYNIPCNRETIYKIDGFGKKKVDSLIAEIEKSKTQPLDRVLYGLSIPQIGKTASKKLAEYFGNIDNLLSSDKYTYYHLIGDSAGNSLNEFLHWNESMKQTIHMLRSYELTMTQPKQQTESDILNGKTFVITGDVEHFKNRKELENKIVSLGGKIGSGVSKTTDYLINNDSTRGSSKNVKAKSLGVKIITEEEFLGMMN